MSDIDKIKPNQRAMDRTETRRILENWINEGYLAVMVDEDQPTNPKKQRLIVWGMNASHVISLESTKIADEVRPPRDA